MAGLNLGPAAAAASAAETGCSPEWYFPKNRSHSPGTKQNLAPMKFRSMRTQ